MEGLASLKFLDCMVEFEPLSRFIPVLSYVQELRLEPRFETTKGVDLIKLVALEKLEGCRLYDIGDFRH